ncbi:hypothetical protein Tco_0693333, partial [Tanacetum coccineum]
MNYSKGINNDNKILWYPRESPFVLEAYSDSDYVGANKDRKSTTGGCQFLGRRLISWQCKKQKIVATSSTEAEYVIAANCCGQTNGSRGSLELGPPAILATIDETPYTITEDSVRSSLQLADDGGIDDLPIAEIYSGMDNLGYVTEGKLTFYKNKFSPQWRFLVHTILHCLSTKSGSWDQFGSSLVVALICLSDGRIFNWSSYIFKVMVSNIGNAKKFLMYPRFLQTILGIETSITRQYHVFKLYSKLFANMKLNFEGQPMPLLATMLPQDQEGEGVGVAAQAVPPPIPEPIPEPMPKPDQPQDHLSIPQRQQTSDPIAPVFEHGQSLDPNIASFSRVSKTDDDPFTSTNVEDEPLGGSFHASPPRSTRLRTTRSCLRMWWESWSRKSKKWRSRIMDLEQNNSLAKLSLLKQGEYDTWRLRIESYIQLQDYSLWEIIEEGNSFKPVAQTTREADGTSTTTIHGVVTAEEKILKKNDLKARSILMMTLP